MGEVKLGWPVWIGVVSDDLEGQRRFYRDVLGLKELGAGDDWVQFDLDGRMLELLARSEEPQYRQRRIRSSMNIGTSFGICVPPGLRSARARSPRRLLLQPPLKLHLAQLRAQ